MALWLALWLGRRDMVSSGGNEGGNGLLRHYGYGYGVYLAPSRCIWYLCPNKCFLLKPCLIKKNKSLFAPPVFVSRAATAKLLLLLLPHHARHPGQRRDMAGLHGAPGARTGLMCGMWHVALMHCMLLYCCTALHCTAM
jgi:hypothetical protein